MKPLFIQQGKGTRDSYEIYNHVSSCEQFNYIKTTMELTAHQESKVTCVSSDFRFDYCKIIDRADHCLYYSDPKPILNHGTKASEELIYYLTKDLI
jgi:hypothetical protein